MCLTLRTLLAYLDDTLEPTQAKQIGQKVAESDAAQELIARIKQVTRRRRLMTPSPHGPAALDPNTVAEYLENVLSSDQLAEVEETCLAHDAHLAEVASCHQILTLVLGEPALVPPMAKQRMYRLIQGREAIHSRKAPKGVAAAVPNGGSPGDEADEALLLGLPLYRRDSSWLRWLVPLAGCCLLLGLLLALLMLVYPLLNPQPVASLNKPSVERPVDVPPPDPNAGKAAQPEQPGEPERKPEQAKKDPEPNGEPGKKGPGPFKEPVKAPPEVDKGRPRGPSKERLPVGRFNVRTGAAPSFLLRRGTGRAEWQRLASENPVHATDYLVSLPGYRSELHLESGVVLTLWGNLPEFFRYPVLESAVTLHADPDFDLDLTLERGRIVLTNQKGNASAKVRVRFLEEVWDLTLYEKNTEVALELFGVPLPYDDRGASESAVQVPLWLLKGEANLKIGYQEQALPTPCIFLWDNVGAPRPPQRLAKMPEWYINRLATPTAQARPMAAAMDELSTSWVRNSAVDVAFSQLAKRPDVASRVLAVRCRGAINDLGSLVDSLANEKSLEVRHAAAEELEHWLGLDARHDQQLLQVLRNKNYPEPQAQTVLQLLHGFSEQRVADPTLRGTLAQYLMHDQLAIRQLAYRLLVAIVPDGAKIKYDAAADERQRQALEEWKRLLTEGKAPPRK